MCLGPQPNAISMKSYSYGSSYMMKYNKSMVMRFWSAMISRVCVRPTSKSWFLNRVKIIMKHDPLMPCRNPCRLYIHIAFTDSISPSSVVCWTGSTFSTKANARIAMVTGTQSCVWSRPEGIVCTYILSCNLRHICNAPQTQPLSCGLHTYGRWVLNGYFF